MKIKKASLIPILLTINAYAIPMDIYLQEDSQLDGVVENASLENISLSREQSIFSGAANESIYVGEYLHNDAIIKFTKGNAQDTTYYIGHKTSGSEYQGTWYQAGGAAGDFTLSTDSNTAPDCSGASETGWHSGIYCNMDVDGGNWQLVAVRMPSTARIAVKSISSLTFSQYLSPEQWEPLMNRSSEILFYQPDTKQWGTMTVAAASNNELCSPLNSDLSKDVLVHAEVKGCNITGLDYTLVGHRDAYRQAWLDKRGPKIWERTSAWNPSTSSAQLMVFVR